MFLERTAGEAEGPEEGATGEGAIAAQQEAAPPEEAPTAEALAQPDEKDTDGAV